MFILDRLQQIMISTACLLLLLGIGIPNISDRSSNSIVKTVPIMGSLPSLCIGYNPDQRSWGHERQMCPANYAAYAVDDPSGPERSGAFLDIQLVCCPLPATDILGDEHVFVDAQCPEDHIVTGSTGFGCGRDCVKQIRCTKINAERYQLGERSPGVYWGNGHSGWKHSKRINRNDIPAGIRYAVGRSAQHQWDIDGCVGSPSGSLLVGKTSKYCSGMQFRQLEFSGVKDAPLLGKSVRMFPECSEVKNHANPEKARCLRS